MHRRPLLQSLERLVERHPGDCGRVETIRRFVTSHADCFLRSCVTGHITASAWIVSPDWESYLLVDHKRLGLWLQLGGHADGSNDAATVALCEAREESGLRHFRFHVEHDGLREPFDVDTHRIPPIAGVPEHDHHDIRFLLVAEEIAPLTVSDESHDVRWFRAAEHEALLGEESLRRMARRAREAG